MAIDTSVPNSPGWWLQKLYLQLRVQEKRCNALQLRYEGESPMPFISDIQKAAVKWFVSKSRTNYERVIVDAKLSRLSIQGIHTAVGTGAGGDAEGFKTWKAARGKLVTLDVHEMALAMSLGYLIIGKDSLGNVLITAEDPRLVTATTDPTNPYKVLAALKLCHDFVYDMDVAYLYLPGQVWVAKKPRKARAGASSADIKFNPNAYAWDLDIVDAGGALISEGESGDIDWLQDTDDEGNVINAVNPVVPFFTGRDAAHSMSLFEPYLSQIDRLNQQMLQRMTIATIQAFKQRAFKGLPQTDPDTGEEIDYNDIFSADPGAVWNLPDTVDIWESGAVDIGPLVVSYRDDVKDLYSVSGTPSYLASDAANQSAEGASNAREMTIFGVERLQDRFELSHELAAEIMFRTLGDAQRSTPGTVSVIWSPAERLSVGERASALAQTKGILPRYEQYTEVWGMDPASATQAQSDFLADLVLDQQFAAAQNAANTLTGNAGVPSGTDNQPG